jgi:hypothetical protein
MEQQLSRCTALDDPADALLMELQRQQPDDDPFYGLTHLKTGKGSSNGGSNSTTVLQQVLAKDEAVRRVLQEILQDAQAEAVVVSSAAV